MTEERSFINASTFTDFCGAYSERERSGVTPMSIATQKYTTTIQHDRHGRTIAMRLKPYIYKHIVLLICTVVLLFGSLLVNHNIQQNAHAANPGSGNACSWYTIRFGDTLANIASGYHTNIWTLARVNGIGNINLIFSGQQICIPHVVHSSGGQSSGGSGTSSGGGQSGILANGYVPWYNYNALEWSSRNEVSAQLRQIAVDYGLPTNLVLAIAWQESGWTQHVIARDGGIGVMQLMPYTAMSLNSSTGIHRDPYKLWDNLNLGATYLHYLWGYFHGNLYQVISAYNEGGWAVTHRGIFNWNYVNNVMYLMRTL